MKNKFSFIIVNYNTKDITLNCVESLLNNKYLAKIDYEIIIIDNCSSDGSIELFKEKFNRENIIVKKNKFNSGFGDANNIGSEISSGDILVFINSDTIANKTDFSILRDNVIKNNVGFLTCKILNRDGSIQSLGNNYPSISNDLKINLLLWNYNFMKRIRFKNYNNKGLIKVDWISGSFMLCRKSCFDKIGGFDKNIFMYSEDIDICKRMELIGKENYVYDKTYIYHLHGESSKGKKLSLRKMLKSKENYYYVIKKDSICNGIGLIRLINTIHIFLLYIFKNIVHMIKDR